MSDANESQDNTPAGIQIDDDWKAQAKAEKVKLAEKEQHASANAPTGPGGQAALPPADFKGLIGVLASQAIMGLGAMPDPQGRGVMIDLDGAKFAIDLLSVVEEKTKGNLSADEDQELAAVLGELRARFVQVTKILAEQMTAGDGTPDTSPSTGSTDAPPKIIMPE